LIVTQWVRAEVNYIVAQLANVIKGLDEDLVIDLPTGRFPSRGILQQPDVLTEGQVLGRSYIPRGVLEIPYLSQGAGRKEPVDSPAQPAFNLAN
jgi:hypothetical protein